MAEVDLPPDEPPISESGERHSRERIARPTRTERLKRRAYALLSRTILSTKTRTVWIRALIVPLILAIVPLFWVIDATQRASITTIGRDQGIFHYIAWAVKNGDIDYRDVRDVNGPLTHLIHMIMLSLGGGDEHRFHVIDLTATSIAFAIVGLLLPGIVMKHRPSIVERVGWGFASWTVLMAQYGLYLYWNQAQRESFCNWFLLPSIALQAMAVRRAEPDEPSERRERVAFRRVMLIAGLSTITWFSKPSFALLTAAQLLALLLDDEHPLSRIKRVTSFFIGGVLGTVIPLVYLFRYGDILAFLQITLRDVPQMYRFIWARSPQEILGDDGPLGVATMGIAISCLITALVVLRNLPRRALVLAFTPLAALAGAIAQKKGFGYHFHPLTATMHIGCMLVIAMMWERYRFTPRHRPMGRFVALGLAAAYALEVASAMRASPHTRNHWLLSGGETEEKRADREWFDSFKTHDFFPWEMRQGARYLTDVTKPDARVQIYGMDPYLLFLARRKSATPYIYAYDLNSDAAVEGGWSAKPTWFQAEHIRALRSAHERDMLARLKEAPPEAFVFIDKSPLITYQDAWEDFRHCCAESAAWVATHYHSARSFDEVHVWLRDDMPVKDREGDMP